MTHLGFFVRQAFLNMNRHRQRTIFVLFCIAVGVAVVVGLRTLGFMIEDTLTLNLQAENGGDVRVRIADPFTTLGQSERVDPVLIEQADAFGALPTFSDEGIARIEAWAAENGYEVTRAVRQHAQGRARPVDDASRAAAESIFFLVEPDSYPFYREIELQEPPGRSFAQAVAAEKSIVISEQMAEELSLGVGEEVYVAGRNRLTVSGIVPNGAEASLTDINALLLPYGYISYEAGTKLFATRADTIYLRIPAGTSATAATDDFQDQFPGFNVTNTDDLREINSTISDAITELITVLGLVSLLIGGIGIVNTMIVIVGRRTTEIGVLKTIGLHGRQITLMFMIEALILGIIGSAVGLVLSLSVAYLLKNAAERIFAQGLAFAVYPEALLLGIVLGVVVTLVFGFLPTLSAGRLRPSVVLQPSETVVPRAGRLITLLVVLGTTAIIGVLVGVILENYLIGFAAAYGALLLLGLAVFLFWLLIVFMSRLPSFGVVRLKLAQRALGANAGRVASTLLALVVGMGSLSLIILMTNSLVDVVEQFSQSGLGGNVLVQTESLESAAALDERLAELDGINEIQRNEIYQAEIVAIDGNRDLEAVRQQAVERGRRALGMPAGDGSGEIDLGPLGSFDPVLLQVNLFLELSTISVREDGEPAGNVIDGTDITAASEQAILLQENPALAWLGVDVGDTVTFQYRNGTEATVTVAGITGVAATTVEFSDGSETTIVASADAIPAGVNPSPPSYILDVQPELVDATVDEISAVPGAFALDASQINVLFERLIDQFTALPLVIAILALAASAIIIANTVSLATLERRREIGILKAIGLQARSVLGLLLLENGLIGLLGGLIGVGLGATGIFFLDLFTNSLSGLPFLTLGGLVLLSVVIALGATLITAVGAAREKPLVVLRYE